MTVDIPDTWQPTSEAINALPGPLRRYIHDLEARADPAGDVRARIVAEENAKALAERVRELQEATKVDFTSNATVERIAVQRNLALQALGLKPNATAEEIQRRASELLCHCRVEHEGTCPARCRIETRDGHFGVRYCFLTAGHAGACHYPVPG